MNKYDAGLMTVIENTILQRVNSTSQLLQSVKFTLLRGTKLFNSLQNFIKTFRDEFNNTEKEAPNLTSLSFEEIDMPRKKINITTIIRLLYGIISFLIVFILSAIE